MVIRLKKKTNNYKVAVVTGAGSGIGKTVANALMQVGFHTYLVGRNKINLNKTKYEATKQKGYIRCSVFKCDVSNENNVKELQGQLQAAYSRIAELNAEVDLYKKKYRDYIDNNEYKEKYRNLRDHQRDVLNRDFKMRQKALTELNYDGNETRGRYGEDESV